MDQNEVRKKIEEMGVDTELLSFIDNQDVEVQKGIYTMFIDILTDELLFVISLMDAKFAEAYAHKREHSQPLIMN